MLLHLLTYIMFILMSLFSLTCHGKKIHNSLRMIYPVQQNACVLCEIALAAVAQNIIK